VPSNLTPLGALPARFRRERVLIVGCGDVGQRVAAVLTRRARVLALTSSPERVPALRALGLTPLRGNLDDPSSLRRLAGVATRVLHLAPPPQEGDRDPRTRTLLRVLARRSPPRSLVYGSTSGVYGDCQGAWVMESRPLAPFTRRAMRRVDAEDAVRHWGRRQLGIARAMVLRIPGIYAPDRPGGTPRDRLLRGTPVLQQQDDVYTNHIHANDLARACDLALWRTRAQRVMHVSDDSDLQMADYYDLAADMYGLPRPRRLPRQAAESELPLMLLSFMSESRRLDNTRLRRELRLRLRYPTVIEGLQEDPRVLKRP
jgi:nucleoside-diphosphate-sugar epimerase